MCFSRPVLSKSKKLAKFVLLVLIGLIGACPQADHYYSEQQENPDHAGTFPEIDSPEYNFKREFGIVIPVYNRPEFLGRTLRSLAKTSPEDLKKSHIIIVDDGSSDPETKKLIAEFDLDGVIIQKLRHNQNRGILTSLFHGFKLLARNVDYVLNIDADVVMNSNWLSKLKQTHGEIGSENIILTGFNANTHKTSKEFQNYVEKEDIGGINFFMSSKFYNSHFQVWFHNIRRLEKETWRNWDWIAVDKMAENGFKFYSTKPSVIQHIGIVGLNSNETEHDVANDFVPDA